MPQFYSKLKWKRFFKDRGLSNKNIDIYLAYIDKLTKNKAPVIFEFEHLSILLGINRKDLAKIINSPESFHRTFFIPKRRGGKREIVAPYPSLLQCQDWVYKNILLEQPISSCAHGFVPGRSIITNASMHLDKKVLLKMDLKNFFPSIPINWIIKYFRDLGYANNVSFYLASICCYDGHLGQGSSTSPYFTNILFKPLDEKFSKIASKYHLDYTRYADDLVFSGGHIPHRFISIVTNHIEKFNLTVNEDKTALHTKKGQRIVTGISVAGTELKLPRKTKRELKKEVYFINKYGFLSHASKLKISNPYYLDSLIGKLQFWLQVEPGNEFAQQAISDMKLLKAA